MQKHLQKTPHITTDRHTQRCMRPCIHRWGMHGAQSWGWDGYEPLVDTEDDERKYYHLNPSWGGWNKQSSFYSVPSPTWQLYCLGSEKINTEEKEWKHKQKQENSINISLTKNWGNNSPLANMHLKRLATKWLKYFLLHSEISFWMERKKRWANKPFCQSTWDSLSFLS